MHGSCESKKQKMKSAALPGGGPVVMNVSFVQVKELWHVIVQWFILFSLGRWSFVFVNCLDGWSFSYLFLSAQHPLIWTICHDLHFLDILDVSNVHSSCSFFETKTMK